MALGIQVKVTIGQGSAPPPVGTGGLGQVSLGTAPLGS